MPSLDRAIVLLLTWIAGTGTACHALQAGDYTFSLQSGGLTRSYLAHIPANVSTTVPSSVVLAFHGGGSNARQMMSFCGLNEKADEAGFVVVYPSGSGRLTQALTWNAGSCCGYARLHQVDDVAFVEDLLNDLGKRMSLDPKRIFATGISNGAMMVYRLASELSNRIAAIAPVSGPMGTETCKAKRPVSVMHFHGTADEFAPYAGGRGTKSITQTEFLSAEYSVKAWGKANGCPDRPDTQTLPDKAKDGMTVTRQIYGLGREDSEVVLITINGGGHTWPGREPRVRFLGKSTLDISANDLMWEFFMRHPMK